MGDNAWKNCMECGKKTKHLRIFKNQMLCFQCYQKVAHIMGGPMRPDIEPRIVNCHAYFAVKESMRLDLTDRMKYLFGSPYKMGEYVRLLIEQDLKQWTKENKENKTEQQDKDSN